MIILRNIWRAIFGPRGNIRLIGGNRVLRDGETITLAHKKGGWFKRPAWHEVKPDDAEYSGEAQIEVIGFVDGERRFLKITGDMITITESHRVIASDWKLYV